MKNFYHDVFNKYIYFFKEGTIVPVTKEELGVLENYIKKYKNSLTVLDYLPDSHTLNIIRTQLLSLN